MNDEMSKSMAREISRQFEDMAASAAGMTPGELIRNAKRFELLTHPSGWDSLTLDGKVILEIGPPEFKSKHSADALKVSVTRPYRLHT